VREPKFKHITIVYYTENRPEPWLATITDFPKKVADAIFGEQYAGYCPHGHGRTPEIALEWALCEARVALRKYARKARRSK
jgi:hypothetical protein